MTTSKITPFLCSILILLVTSTYANNRVALLVYNGLQTSLIIEEKTPARTWEITPHQERIIDLNTFENDNNNDDLELELTKPHILKIAYQKDGQFIPLTQCLQNGINNNGIIQVFNSNTGVECLYTEYQDTLD